jgi:dCTP deaminase
MGRLTGTLDTVHRGITRSRPPARFVLADHQILNAVKTRDLSVSPFEADMIRPAALSLRLGAEASVLAAAHAVDARDLDTYPRLTLRLPDGFGRLVINPGELLLAPTMERVAISNRLTGILDGISDVARLGISVVLSHQVSPGYGWPDGAALTLEIVSRLPVPVMLYPGTRICNLMLLRCGRAAKSYSSMLHNHSRDVGAMPSNWAAYHKKPQAS